MIDDNFIIFDTETTGIGEEDEIVEMGIIDCKGNVLYEGMFRPERGMSIGATRLNGITDSMLVREPLFADEFPKIVAALNGAGVIAFNESFDRKMVYQTAEKYGLDTSALDRIFSNAYCAQKLYDQYIGYTKTKLELACETEGVQRVQNHRATDDCVMTLDLLRCIADKERTPDYDKYCKVRARATGKSVEEVSRPLGGPAKRKDPMYLEYAKMFQEGIPISEMATFKKVKEQTVEENLIDAYKNGHVESIDFMIQPEFESSVRACMQRVDWDGRFTSIKNALPDACTWTTIKAVVAKAKTEAKGQKPIDAVLSDAKHRSEKGNGASASTPWGPAIGEIEDMNGESSPKKVERESEQTSLF